jgi:hypothetical protein
MPMNFTMNEEGRETVGGNLVYDVTVGGEHRVFLQSVIDQMSTEEREAIPSDAPDLIDAEPTPTPAVTGATHTHPEFGQVAIVVKITTSFRRLDATLVDKETGAYVFARSLDYEPFVELSDLTPIAAKKVERSRGVTPPMPFAATHAA